MDINIKTNDLIAMAIVAFGFCCVEWTYYPKLPKPFSENLPFVGMCDNKANLLCLTLDDSNNVKVWFEDEMGDTKALTLDEVKVRYPFMFVSLITHICDMIENAEV